MCSISVTRICLADVTLSSLYANKFFIIHLNCVLYTTCLCIQQPKRFASLISMLKAFQKFCVFSQKLRLFDFPGV